MKFPLRIMYVIFTVFGRQISRYTDCSRGSDQADDKVKYLITSFFPKFDKRQFTCRWM